MICSFGAILVLSSDADADADDDHNGRKSDHCLFPSYAGDTISNEKYPENEFLQCDLAIIQYTCQYHTFSFTRWSFYSTKRYTCMSIYKFNIKIPKYVPLEHNICNKQKYHPHHALRSFLN